jgi:uncharacterized protein
MMRLAAALLTFLVVITPAWAAPKFPALTGRVVDDANILSSGTKADLTQKLAALEQKTSRQLVVVTVPSLTCLGHRPDQAEQRHLAPRRAQ